MSKYLFLDIDGVLNSHEYWASKTNERSRDEDIDPSAVNILNTICDIINPIIIISSSWRILYDANMMQKILNNKGFKHKIYDITPVLYTKDKQRGDEISLYMRNNNISKNDIIILDDDSDMRDLKDRLVKTSFEEGLKEEHIEKILKLT